MPGLLKGRRVLVAASGSIAAVKTPLLVSALVQAGAQVRCVLTESAARLVSPVALATLSRQPCLQDADQWDPACPRHCISNWLNGRISWWWPRSVQHHSPAGCRVMVRDCWPAFFWLVSAQFWRRQR